ncbi:CubicO group peptidase (beta-lactamase class C family) [Paenibacillus cellulosilyticus]|uniref:CubicO group peptidase (Beta-lactamase class C family) n=1 Tax=Paenibacillus cellulosilyticus TaxID=375489 RepID=A0A2V2YLR4_9BACL|nr:serine hydrolase [Paenibacillus cellulosilyticus]PWV95195.1 CubicO group peptidase (beta-lactamase class C family) [Paenibacillus cellulosilyticus]QKS46051.1 serine hydrolase [Paenibacillus cellulosilyticus]
MTAVIRLPRATPEQTGIPSQAISAFLDQLKRDALEIHGFMVIRNGSVAAEGWWEPYSAELPHLIFSITKSFTATAVGFAVQEGLLNVHDKVVSYFPDELPAQPSDHLLAMTIHDLLAMATGQTGDPTEESISQGGDWVRTFFEAPIPYAPGTHFAYNSGASHILGVIVERVSGQSLQAFLAPRLLEPLGIEVAEWQKLPGGHPAGGFGLCITLEDVAKLGLLYLQRGVWNGQRLLDESWIDASSALQVSNGTEPDNDWAAGYGYQLWRCRFDAYRFAGLFCQKCIIIPSHNMLVVLNSADWDEPKALNAVWEHLLPAVSEQSLPANVEAHQQLLDRIAALTLSVRLGETGEKQHFFNYGTTYRLESNLAGWESIQLEEQNDRIVITVTGQDGEKQFAYGVDQWVYAGERLKSTAGRALWNSEGELKLVQHEVWTPFSRTVTIREAEEGMTLHIRRNVSWPLFGWKDENDTVLGTPASSR